ncbi:glycosyl transferase family 2 [Paenibacillus swuensis]|uniref:Glycosyl transferase family 2 n=2 Tax=Paenibacillus swuensis TaxID=1178515 RepID=A0A172TPH1_9BACL|nr:glycosyl transferase family 2 [Paenibacillus swuensis]
MIVRNEQDRYLGKVLEKHRAYIDEAIIIDDASTDETVQLCMEKLAGIPLTIIRNDTSCFHNEVQLRMQQWAATVNSRPEWILNMDADETFEDSFRDEVSMLMENHQPQVYYFRLYDMWNDCSYREDAYWQAHRTYRPFLHKYQTDYSYYWKKTPQHCGRFPTNVGEQPYLCSKLRVQHWGWSRLTDRQLKYKRYMELDPDGRYGWLEQYESILDPNPSLMKWSDSI